MKPEDAAKRTLGSLCDEQFEGFGVIFTDSAIVRDFPKRRALAREKEQRRLGKVVREIVLHLQGGGTPASANGIADSAGFAGSIAVARGYGELLRAVQAIRCR